MTKLEAIDLMQNYLKNENLQKHSIAVGAIMRALAEKFGENTELWEITGILHDLDYEQTQDTPEKHGYQTVAILQEKAEYNLPDTALQAIQAHPGHEPRTTPLAKALFAADPLSGLILAGALMHPKQLDMPVKSLKKRFKDKRFAAGANREQIALCSELDLPIEEFFSIALAGMKEAAHELGF